MIGILVDIFLELTGLRRAARNYGENLGKQLGEKFVGSTQGDGTFELAEVKDTRSDEPYHKQSESGGKNSAAKTETTVLVVVLALVATVVIAIPLLTFVQKVGTEKKVNRISNELSETAAAEAAVPTGSGTMFLANVPGMTVNLSKTLQDGKTTILYFHSDGCHYCREMEDKLIRLAVLRPDIAIAKVDIDRSGKYGIDFRSPAAYQFSITRVPCFRIYSPARLCIAKGDSARQLVEEMCVRANSRM